MSLLSCRIFHSFSLVIQFHTVKINSFVILFDYKICKFHTNTMFSLSYWVLFKIWGQQYRVVYSIISAYRFCLQTQWKKARWQNPDGIWFLFYIIYSQTGSTQDTRPTWTWRYMYHLYHEYGWGLAYTWFNL